MKWPNNLQFLFESDVLCQILLPGFFDCTFFHQNIAPNSNLVGTRTFMTEKISQLPHVVVQGLTMTLRFSLQLEGLERDLEEHLRRILWIGRGFDTSTRSSTEHSLTNFNILPEIFYFIGNLSTSCSSSFASLIPTSSSIPLYIWKQSTHILTRTRTTLIYPHVRV